MYHPTTLLHMARERQQQFRDEARHDDLVRELTSVQRQVPRERFRIRDLRWVLFRQAGA
ncbi:MAG: hypothetical protein WEG56_12330 [Chloroflexota bacterium]